RSKQLAAPTYACPAVPVDGHDPDCVVDDGEDDEYQQGAGTVFLVAGTGGAELYEVHADDPEAPYFA
ncbi:hypothetical protein WFJ45_22430, partial [Salmonella enterica subsp. enterica serovar Minnesota]|uniref:hypothetical protein n=1 Tax=Salmonella enterica TaxID=28901 RepID=UPI003D2BBB8A